MEKKQAKEKKRLHENSKFLSRNTSAVIREKITSTQSRKREPLSTVPENVALEEVTKSLKTKGKVKVKGVKEGPKRKTNENDEALECSRIKLSKPPPLDHFNNVFDTLRNTTNFETPNEKDLIQRENPIKEKKLRVRVARVKQKASSRADTDCIDSETVFQSNKGTSSVESNIQTASVESSSVPSSSDTNNSNFELLSWLKNITDTEHIPRNDEIFKEMRICKLMCTCSVPCRSNLLLHYSQCIKSLFY